VTTSAVLCVGATEMSERLGTYMTVTELPQRPGLKTRRWDIRNLRGGYSLGDVCWYGPWRQYVFAPEPATEFSVGCLRDIAGFLERVNKEQRA